MHRATISIFLALALLNPPLRASRLLGQVRPSDRSESQAATIQFNLIELDSSRAAQRVLAAPAQSFFIIGVQLRDALADISRTHRLSIWIDRRIDPNQLISFSVKANQSIALEECLQKIAILARADVGLIENVVIVAPAGVPAAAERAAVQLHNALSLRDSTARMQPLAWEELTTPREMLEQIEQLWDIDVTVELPHDLLHAGQLISPCTLATQLTILCAGFGLEVLASGDDQLVAAKLRPQPVWEGRYDSKAIQLRDRKALLEKFSGSQITSGGGLVTVSGPGALHRALLLSAYAGTRKPSPRDPRQRYTLTVPNEPAEKVIDAIAMFLGLAVDWNARCTDVQRQQRITFEVTHVTFDKLLASFGRASGLKVEIIDDRVLLSPAE